MSVWLHTDESDQTLSAAARVDVASEVTEKAVSRAVGEELRRAREARGWSRGHLVSLLPSGIGDRSLPRQLTVLRLIEICRALAIDMASLVSRALQRARLHLENLTMSVDLNALLRDRSDTFRPMVQWARNALNLHPNGVVEVEPVVVRNLALFSGCEYLDLANYLARFIPEHDCRQ